MGLVASAQNNVAEEVAWVVGDEPIYKSEIEEQYQQALYERADIDGNPYCVIPERMAIEKLFLHQAKIDTVEVQNSMVQQAVDARINYFIANLGSKEKVEEYFRKPMPELREQLINTIRDQYTIQQVQSNLTKDVKATPADVRKYYNELPKDSLPYIPKEVEVEIITINPIIPQQEIDEVKARLRDYAKKVNNGEADFSTLAILYSEDGSSAYGGEIGFRSKAELDPEYANVAFNLSDPKKVSKIVETEFGYHIIQLIEKRGDRINTRHILLRPKVSQKDLDSAVVKLDSLKADISRKKFTFEEAAMYVSQDKDSKNNNGLMLNEKTRTNRFEMADLPQEVGKVVDKLKEGEISAPFIMMNEKTNRQQVAMVKLVKRIDGHKADLAEDYQKIKDMYEDKKKQQIIENWVKEKQKKTYVYIEDGWRNCEFKYNWMKK
ncbi:MAG: peptidylprolyl isomerase [Sodaliphilus pleomorphus]|jgi:peptidyl-prolyl cis-trans isomerase SurA|uniref:Peptidylprolyl isomerase n=1 Tax=Sodaliphilus pleomorphus TaxID=2606626 RepID=A0A6L5XDI6_9BACT|nr:peptidylprolyl isomerase [Sodaliphilus pleomorphus]MCI5980187.1 peptidylprolyl isomerase [Muribaculaceae bacterium]MDY6259310.1 peptidylprolyl isomerase [Bacteroidales bacterium]MCI6169454.1 peptidylprolyl isomerase [Muribaculaceae bacterium]MDD6474665.1 peptidylprolyl isomerase [Sodaliphilus pleomorphus]MDD6687136.1 peptidylprolyl isomerase [Sodaliphilus pleomorphus]